MTLRKSLVRSGIANTARSPSNCAQRTHQMSSSSSSLGDPLTEPRSSADRLSKAEERHSVARHLNHQGARSRDSGKPVSRVVIAMVTDYSSRASRSLSVTVTGPVNRDPPPSQQTLDGPKR